MMYPWLDRKGRLSPLRAGVFTGLFLPGLVLVYRWMERDLGARPLTELNHVTGLWAIRLVVITLAVTPLRSLLRWQELFSVRRMLGVGAFGYAAIHFGFYVADQSFAWGKIASEILHRFYLTIGFLALIALLALAATSTDGAIRRMGGAAWRRLHQLVYPLALLAAIHYFLQSKLNVDEPIVLTGLLIWLLGFRLARAWLSQRGPLPWRLALFTLVSALVTWGAEIAYYHCQRHIPLNRIMIADFSTGRDLFGIRPIWWVLVITGALTLAAVIRARATPAPAGTTRTKPLASSP